MRSKQGEFTLADVYGLLGLRDPIEFLHEVYHTLSEVYRLNSERHDESVGDDMMTFAQLIYRNSWAQLEVALPRLDSRVWTDRPEGSLTIHTPGRALKVYRGGSQEEFEIEDYDPETGSLTRQRIAKSNFEQLSLFKQDWQSDTAEDVDARLSPDVWFIVHSGNPKDGLLNVWIGAPLASAGAHQSPWSFVLALPDLCAEQGCGGPDTDSGVWVTPSPSAPSGPSFGQIPQPEIRIEPSIDHGS